MQKEFPSLVLFSLSLMITNTACLQKDRQSNVAKVPIDVSTTNISLSTSWSSLAEYCHEFNIAVQQCKCQICYNESENTNIENLPNQICLMFNKTTKDCSSPKPTLKTTTIKSVDITDLSLEEVCQMFRIKTEDCVCPSIILSTICDTMKNKQQKRQTIVHCNISTAIRSIIMIITTISIIGNFLVVAVTKYRWKKSPTSSKLVGALALSDFFFSVFTFTNEIYVLWTCKWIHGLFMCKFLRPAINMTATMALGFILMISIERFFGIVYPFKQIITITKVYIMSFLNVLISLIVVIPCLLYTSPSPRDS